MNITNVIKLIKKFNLFLSISKAEQIFDFKFEREILPSVV